MNLSAFFSEIEADMISIAKQKQYTGKDLCAAHQLAMQNSSNQCIAAGRWFWCGSTLVRVCDVSYSWGQFRFPDLTMEQVSQYCSEQIQHLWHSARRSFDLPDHVIVMLGCTELHQHTEAVAVHSAHHAALSELRSAGVIKNFTIIASVNHAVEVVKQFEQHPDTVVIPWFLYSYSSLYTRPVPPRTDSKILFTPGKLAWDDGRRLDRVVTLCYLLDKTNHHRWLWSYTGTKYDSTPGPELNRLMRTVIAQRLPHSVRIPRGNPLLLFEPLARSVDSATQHMWADRGFHRVTLALPLSVYAQTAVEFVTETWFDCATHLTEKIFRPMLTGTPWLTACPAHTDHLEAVTAFRGYRSELTLSQPAPQVHNVRLEHIAYDCEIPAVEELREIHHTPGVQAITAHNSAHCKHLIKSTDRVLNQRHPGINTQQLKQITLSLGVVPAE